MKDHQDATTAVISEAASTSSDEQVEKTSANIIMEKDDQQQSARPEGWDAILNRQVDTPQRTYSAWHLYRYASNLDLAIIFVSVVASCASGAAMPCMTLVFGGMQGAFQDFLVLGTTSREEFQSKINDYALYFVYLGIGSFVATYVSTIGFLYTGENITINLRQRYLESCLRQNIGFFDKTSAAEVASKITSDANKIQDGISEKVSLFTTAIASLTASFIIGFTVAWKLTLVMSSVFFALLLGVLAISMVIPRFIMPLTMAIIQSSTLAHEAFANVRVAIAFRSQEYLANRYDVHLQAAQTHGFKIKACVAVLMAFFMGMSPLTYSLGFWQGSLFLVKGEITIEAMLTTIMVILIGSYNVGFLSPYIQAFNAALSTASNLMIVIDREPTVDATDMLNGERPGDLNGTISFQGVSHVYPSRPEAVVLDDLSITFHAGETTAIVGPSGSGKSTIFGLLQRFYEPVQGTIFLDGLDTKTLNLHWLRQQIGVVGQEPVLFAGSVYENIRNGLAGSQYEHADDDLQRELVVRAAKTAQAHDFITTQLIDGYETDVGQRALLLSGGQRQRIAIARAIVSDPKILLLDEATSALDTKSEAAVQLALEQASVGRTTITIAHRLSTVRKAHKIIVLAKGKLVEQGTHDELLEQKGAYHHLVDAQELQPSSQDGEVIEERKLSDDVSSATDESIGPVGKPSSTEHSSSALDVALQGHNRIQQVSLGDESDYSFWELVKFIFAFNKRDAKMMTVASLFCVLAGIAQPAQSILFAKQLTTLSHVSSPLHDKWQVRHDSNFWSLMLLVSGIVIFLAYLVQGLIFAQTAESLGRRAKHQTMVHMLRQDIGFFDLSKHSPSALGAFISLETAQLASMSGANLGNLITSMSTIIGGAALALSIGWKLALVCLSVVPFLLGCNIVRFFILKQYEGRAARVYVESAAYASENIVAIKTVASLGLERHIADKFRTAMDEQRNQSLKSIAKSGLLFALSQSSILLSLGLAFWYGSTLMAAREYGIFQFFVCLMSIVFGTQAAGGMLAFTPDVVKAKHAAAKLKTLFMSKAAIDTQASHPGGSGRGFEPVAGRIELQNVHFAYPSRPDKPVLRGVDLVIEPSQHVALVGSSGCGKSTIIGLLERFYDPDGGKILLDGKDISSLPVNTYRSNLALVSQEPTLFQGTIRDNIVIGCDERVSDEVVEKACRDASIWDFVASLPDGIDTDVGSAGALLSGGQKQRIAIARALVREPKVLLLDEATSALDSESERAVKDALAMAARGRTTVTVAHRLATVQDADRIFVVDEGRIVEFGTHYELMAHGGLYAELAKLQSLDP